MGTQLAHLPTDLLAQILGYSCIGYAAIELLKCGNALLSTKLRNGGATRVSLHSAFFSSSVLVRIPKLLLELQHLRSLEIATAQYVSIDLRDTSNKLRQLSTSLEELCLNFSNSQLCIADFKLVSPQDDASAVLSRLALEKTVVWNIKRTLPRLRRLELAGQNNNFMFRASYVPYLPAGLRHLKVSATLNQEWTLNPTTCVLETLEVDHLRIPFSQLPPSLSVLRTSTHWNTDMVLLLPENISEVANWKVTKEDLTPQKFTLLNGTIRPITHLSLHGSAFSSAYWEDEQLIFWPPTLTSLSFLAIPPGQRITLELMRSIPRTVTDLSIHLLSDEIASAITWPPLKSLHIRSIGDMQEQAIKALPKSLTLIEQLKKAYFVEEKYLPLQLFKHLPTSLSQLKLRTLYDGVIIVTNSALATPELFTPHLMSVSLSGYCLSAELIACMPPTVTEWKSKASMATPLTPELAARLPRYLSSLSARGLVIQADAIPLIPRGLGTLEISGFEAGEEDDEVESLMTAFSALPRDLCVLIANSSPSPLPKQVLRILPPRLRTVSLYVSQIVDAQFTLPSLCYAPLQRPCIPKHHLSMSNNEQSALAVLGSGNGEKEDRFSGTTSSTDYASDSTLFASLPPSLRSIEVMCDNPVCLSDDTLVSHGRPKDWIVFQTVHDSDVFPFGIVFPAYRAFNEPEFSMTPLSDMTESPHSWTTYLARADRTDD